MKRFMIFICVFMLWLPMQMITLMAQDDIQLDIESNVGYVYNIDTDTAIYEKNADNKIYPASMTKIMTVYTALQYVKDMDYEITLNEKVFNGLARENASVAGFSINDKVSVKDLLYGIMLPSGADACRAIAIYVAGSEEGFVQLMNEQAKKLGLKYTRFSNTTGLHDVNHYTTAKEMAIILKEAIKNKDFMEIFTTKSYQTKALQSNQKGISMQSTMWKYLDTIHADTSLFIGGKTGYTLEAGHCLASLSTKINQAQYITITAQGKGTFQDTVQVEDAQKIYKYLKENYEYRTLYKKGEHMIDIPVKRLIGTSNISYTAVDDIKAVVRKDDEIKVQFQSESTLKEPIKEGDTIGKLVLLGKYGKVKELACISNVTLYPTGLMLIMLILIVLLGLGYWLWIHFRKHKLRRKQLRTMRNRDEIVFDIIHGMNRNRKE